LSLLLFLQILTLLFLILVLALPMSKLHSAPRTVTVIILDQSAGMKATDIAPNRYAVAKEAAEEYIKNNLHGADAAVIIGAGPGPMLICPQSSDKSRLIQKIEATNARDTDADIFSAVKFAHVIARTADSILLVSDAAWSSTLDQQLTSLANMPLRLLPIGSSSSSNIGIVAMSARTDFLHSSSLPHLLITVDRHHSSNAHMRVTFEGKEAAIADIPAGDGTTTEDFPIAALSKGGMVTAKLTGMGRDDLSADNIGSLYVKPNAAKKILMVTDGDPYLERALALLPNVQLYEVKPIDFVPNSGQYDMVVYDQWLPKTVPAGASLVFAAINGDMPVEAAGDSIHSSQIVDWNESDPLLGYVDLSSVHINVAAAATPTLWGTTVADMNHGPAIVKGTQQGRSIVWVAFAPSNSDLPLQVGFPILLSNIVNTLTDSEAGLSQENVTGAPVLLPPTSTAWHVTDPSGTTTDTFCNANSGCEYTNTMTAGIYNAQSANGKYVFACNLASTQGTDISVKDHLLPITSSGGEGIHRLRYRTDLAPWISGLALCIILVEWLIYNRQLRYTRPI
jgi:hypothetical protein